MGRTVRVLGTLVVTGVLMLGVSACTDPPGPPAGNPLGSYDAVHVVDGDLQIDGWAFDPDTAGPTDVRIYVDGVFYGRSWANRSRPDVGAAHGVGADHGFSQPLPDVHGAHFVCVQVTNVGPGVDLDLGCKVGDAPNPYGYADVAWNEPAGVRVRGWTRDPDTPGPITVAVILDGDRAHATRVVAGSPPPAVSSAYTSAPQDADGHSFEAFIPPVYDSVGAHEVVVVAENVSAGEEVVLTSSTGSSSKGAPFGEVTRWDAAEPQGLRISGWAIDPDSAEPVTITVVSSYDNGPIVFRADRPRDDLPAAFAPLGRNHGFEAVVPMPRGNYVVCVGAYNLAGPGNWNDLDCSDVLKG